MQATWSVAEDKALDSGAQSPTGLCLTAVTPQRDVIPAWRR